MEIDPGHTLWIIPYIILMMLTALQTAFHTAQQRLPDAEQKIDPLHLHRSVWLYRMICALFGGMIMMKFIPLPAWICGIIHLVLMYILSVSLPFLIAAGYDRITAKKLYGISKFLTALSFPFTTVLSFTASLPARLLGIGPHTAQEEVTEDEIISMVNEGHEQGAIDQSEAEMITNIFELDDKQAQDIMTHRNAIQAIDGTISLRDAVDFILSAPFSRFPVFEGSIDNIIGALYLKDAASFLVKENTLDDEVRSIPGLLREVKFIPDTISVDDLFREMQASRKQMVIVVNEYGETSGLVTMEDILEEIVGNILDEYDKEEKLIAKLADGKFRINCRIQLDDVEKALNVHFEEEDYDTLNGYLTQLLGHIPSARDRGIVLEDKETGYRFRILSVSGTMIGWVEALYLPEILEKSKESEGD